MSDTPRHVLLVTPSFFGYEQAIAEEVRRQGASVTVLDERPDNSSVGRAVARLAPGLARLLARRHFGRALAEVGSTTPPDLVLVVKGEVVPRWFLRELRRLAPDATFVYYTFDSVRNSPRGATLLDLFDRAYSFDRDDVERVPGLTYKPLFFGPAFGRVDGARRWDLGFVGTVHSARYLAWSRVRPSARTAYGFFYSPARWHHALERLTRSDVRSIPRAEVSFTPLTTAEVAEVVGRSRVVLDVQRTGQSGLTMRTFEALGSGAALLTTNPAVRAEPFYDPRWVHVLEGGPDQWDPLEVTAFVRRAQPAPAELMAEYALEQWVADLLAPAGIRDLEVAG